MTAGGATPTGSNPVTSTGAGAGTQGDKRPAGTSTVDAGSLVPTPPAEHTPGAIDWVLVAGITVLSGWVAVIGLAFLPLYVGGVPLPVSSLLGVAAMILAPRACYRLTGSLVAALLPVLAWFGMSVWVVLSYNRLLPTVPLTVIAGQWRVMVMLGLGALAAAATVGLIWGDRLKDRVAAERSVAGAERPVTERDSSAPTT
jgi:hypothetical protein